MIHSSVTMPESHREPLFLGVNAEKMMIRSSYSMVVYKKLAEGFIDFDDQVYLASFVCRLLLARGHGVILRPVVKNYQS